MEDEICAPPLSYNSFQPIFMNFLLGVVFKQTIYLTQANYEFSFPTEVMTENCFFLETPLKIRFFSHFSIKTKTFENPLSEVNPSKLVHKCGLLGGMLHVLAPTHCTLYFAIFCNS